MSPGHHSVTLPPGHHSVTLPPGHHSAEDRQPGGRREVFCRHHPCHRPLPGDLLQLLVLDLADQSPGQFYNFTGNVSGLKLDEPTFQWFFLT